MRLVGASFESLETGIEEESREMTKLQKSKAGSSTHGLNLKKPWIGDVYDIGKLYKHAAALGFAGDTDQDREIMIQRIEYWLSARHQLTLAMESILDRKPPAARQALRESYVRAARATEKMIEDYDRSGDKLTIAKQISAFKTLNVLVGTALFAASLSGEQQLSKKDYTLQHGSTLKRRNGSRDQRTR